MKPRLVTLLCFVALAVPVAALDADFGSATPSATYKTCLVDNGARHLNVNEFGNVFHYEWLGGSVDDEADCYDDSDSDGIIEVFSSSLTSGLCGDEFFMGCLYGHRVGVVEVDLCVADRNSGRYDSNHLYFGGWWDANHDGDFADSFTLLRMRTGGRVEKRR